MENLTAGNGQDQTELAPLSPAIRFPAQIVSVLLHPLFVPVYITAFLAYIHPLVFAGLNDFDKARFLASVFVNLTLLPAVTVFLLRRLKFIQSIQLNTQKERIIPYAAALIFSFWAWNVFRNVTYAPTAFVQFLLGTFIAVIAAWLANIYFKISMHALAAGGMLYFITNICLQLDGGSGLYIAVAIFLAGIVCTSRLIVSAHRPFEIYAGLILGAASQWIAAVI